MTSFSSVPGRGSPSWSHGWQLIDVFHFPVIIILGSSCALYTYPSTSYRPALECTICSILRQPFGKIELNELPPTLPINGKWNRVYYNTKIKYLATSRVTQLQMQQEIDGQYHTRTNHMVGNIAQLCLQLSGLSWPSLQVNQSKCAQISGC